MAEENKETNSLDDLSKLKVDDKEEVVVNEPKIDTLGILCYWKKKRIYCSCLGKTRYRKNSINGKEMIITLLGQFFKCN